jgi:endonuclease/exonuclease/phosphatase family metal-dependent hydrolase
VLVRTWNLFFGNSFPPQRRAFLEEMIALATADRPDVLCAQEVPAWALGRFTVGDVASRPPLGTLLGRALTAPHHGLIRGAVAGQGLGIWLGPRVQLLDRQVFALNPWRFRRRRARELGLNRRARWTWAKEARIVQVVRLVAQDQRLVVANVHCTGFAGDSRIPDTELIRAARFAALLAEPDDVLVLAGDFNVRRGRSQALDQLTGPQSQWGFSPSGPGIDHVLARGGSVTELRVWRQDQRRGHDGTLLSDHAPVDLEIAPAAT